jgi:chloramphenicol O-acetyltransferase
MKTMIKFCHANVERLKKFKLKYVEDEFEYVDVETYNVGVFDEETGEYAVYHFENAIGYYFFIDMLEQDDIEYDLLDDDGGILDDIEE